MPRRPGSAWPDDVRAQAVDLYATEGLAAAHHATGVPKSTISGWAQAAGVDRAARSDDKRTEAATAELLATLDEARDRRTLQLATAAELALERLLALLEADAAIAPRDLVGIFTRAHHDLALLTGKATENAAVTVVFNVPAPAATPPAIIPQDELPAALGA